MRSKILASFVVLMGVYVMGISQIAQAEDTRYGEELDSFWNIQAYSNGPCTAVINCSSPPTECSAVTDPDDPYDDCGTWQCVEFVRRFYEEHYGYTFNSARYAQNIYLDSNNGQAVAPNLVRFSNGGSTSPMPGDMLGFSGTNGVGHISIVMTVETNSITVIEQNWSRNSVTRSLKMTVRNGNYTVKSGSSNYTVQGWLRMPQSAPIARLEHPFPGSDTITAAFTRAYNSYTLTDGSNPLGNPGGPDNFYPYIYSWGGSGVYIQQYEQPDVTKPRFGDGVSRLYFNYERLTKPFHKKLCISCT